MCVYVCVYTHRGKSTKQFWKDNATIQKRNRGEALKLLQRGENGSRGVEQYGKRFQDEMASELRFGGEVRYEEETQDGHFRRKEIPDKADARIHTPVAGLRKTAAANEVGKASWPSHGQAENLITD